MSDSEPTEGNGNGQRDALGRFAPGNQLAKGNPVARRVNEIRQEIAAAFTPADVVEVLRKLLDAAKSGDVQAAKEFLNRTLGAVVPLDLDGDEPVRMVRLFLAQQFNVGAGNQGGRNAE